MSLCSPYLYPSHVLTTPYSVRIGQYPFAAVVGKAVDHYGPWACSLAASLLFSVGFGAFAFEIAKTPDDITLPSQSSFERLTLFFFMGGLGAVASYVTEISK